jgi:hypothetical protein
VAIHQVRRKRRTRPQCIDDQVELAEMFAVRSEEIGTAVVAFDREKLR